MRIALQQPTMPGPELKSELLTRLAPLGHTLIDLGGDGSNPDDDYPDYSRALAGAILAGKADRGILVCGSGSEPRSPRPRCPASGPGSATTTTRPARASSTTT